LYVPYAVGAQVKFRVATRDDHPIAINVEPVLAAATRRGTPPPGPLRRDRRQRRTLARGRGRRAHHADTTGT